MKLSKVFQKYFNCSTEAYLLFVFICNYGKCVRECMYTCMLVCVRVCVCACEMQNMLYFIILNVN